MKEKMSKTKKRALLGTLIPLGVVTTGGIIAAGVSIGLNANVKYATISAEEISTLEPNWLFKEKAMKVSSKKGSVFQMEAKLGDLEYPYAGGLNNFLIKKNNTDENVGIAWDVYMERENYTKFNINLDWSKINSGDTLRIVNYGVPMWSRRYHNMVMKRMQEGTLAPRPKYIYMGDNAKLLGKSVTYGINKNDIYSYLEDQTLATTYTSTGFALQLAMYYQILFQTLCRSDDPAPAIYGSSTIYDIQGDLWIAYVFSFNKKETAKVVLNSNGRLESLYISEKYYPPKATNIKPVYYTDDNFPAVFIDNNAFSKTAIHCTVDNIVQREGADQININEIYTLEDEGYDVKFKLYNSNDELLGESAVVSMPTSEKSWTKTTWIDLDDNAKAKIKAETGHLKVTYEKVG